MKEFNKTHKPKEIKYNNRTFYPTRETGRKLIFIGYCCNNDIKLIQVNTLQRRLKGVEDLHGKPYQPRISYYSSPQLTDDQYKDLERLNSQADQFHAEYNTGA